MKLFRYPGTGRVSHHGVSAFFDTNYDSALRNGQSNVRPIAEATAATSFTNCRNTSGVSD